MMTIDTLLILALATYRLTALINNEAGPGDMFGKLRTLAGVKFDTYSHPYGTGWLSEGILCFYCLSVWIGGLVTMAYGVCVLIGYAAIALWLCAPFALSGFAIFLKKWLG